METIKELLEKIDILENEFNNAINNNLNAKIKSDLASKISKLSKKLAVLYSLESNKYYNKSSNYDYTLYSYQNNDVEVNKFYKMLLNIINNSAFQKYDMLKIEFDEYGYIGRVHGSDEYGIVHFDYFLLAPNNLIDDINKTEKINNNKLVKIVNDAMVSGMDIFISSSKIALESTFSFFKVKYEIIKEAHNADIYHTIYDKNIYGYSNRVLKFISEYGFDNTFETIIQKGNQVKIKTQIN
jgi:hypothetical protein